MKTKLNLFNIAESKGILKSELVNVLREYGVTGTFSESDWDRYMEIIETEELKRRREKIRLEIASTVSVPEEPLAVKCTRALKNWGKRKWLFPPVKLTQDGQYVKDIDGTVEGKLVYEGVLNE